MGLYPVAVCYNARHDNAIHYIIIQYNIITHITHSNIQHSRQLSIRKIKKKIKNTYYTLKTQKLVEPTVDESVLKTTGYNNSEQTVLYSTQFHTFHQTPTPHSTSLLLYTLHNPPRLNSFLFTAFSWSSPHCNSLHFTPLITFQPLFLEILYFLRTSKSFHFISLNTFLTCSLYTLDFPARQNPFVSLHLLHFSPLSWKFSISSSLWIPCSSFHFSSLITFLTLFLKMLGLEGKFP